MPPIHGTAKWTQANTDMSVCFNETQTTNGIALGLNSPGSTVGLYWNTDHNQGHGLCFAPNRTGKGASVIIPALLNYGGNCFVIDPKGEAAWVTAPSRRKMGQRVVLLDPWNEVNREYAKGEAVEHPTKYNPLSILDPAARTYAEDVALLADALIIAEPGDKSHFPNSAREFVSGLSALVVENWGTKATLRHVRQLITGDPDVLKDLVELTESANPSSLAVRKLRRFILVDNEETQGVRATAETQTAFLDSEDLLDALMDDAQPFSFDDFTKGAVTVYVVIPPRLLGVQARWLRLMLNLVIRAISSAHGRPAQPHLLLVDEMGTIGPLKPLEQGFGLLAGYAVRFFGFFQTLPQLKTDYPKSWGNFIGNSSWIQCLGARELETARYISDLLGSTTITTMKSVPIGDQFGTRTEEVDRQDGMPLMNPQQIIEQLGRYPDQLEKNVQVVIGMQGGTNYKVLQNPYFKHPGYAGRYRPIPWHKPQPLSVPPATGGGQTQEQGGQPKRSAGMDDKKLGNYALLLALLCFGYELRYLPSLSRSVMIVANGGLISIVGFAALVFGLYKRFRWKGIVSVVVVVVGLLGVKWATYRPPVPLPVIINSPAPQPAPGHNAKHGKR